MKLWKIYQDINSGYDTYDSAVVVAADIHAACAVHPNSVRGWNERYPSWASRPDQVGAICIGEADASMEAGTVVVASFNAG